MVESVFSKVADLTLATYPKMYFTTDVLIGNSTKPFDRLFLGKRFYLKFSTKYFAGNYCFQELNCFSFCLVNLIAGRSVSGWKIQHKHKVILEQFMTFATIMEISIQIWQGQIKKRKWFFYFFLGCPWNKNRDGTRNWKKR